MIFIVAALNPWSNFGLNDLDSQPWPLLGGLLFCFSSRHLRTPPFFAGMCLSLFLGVALAMAVEPGSPGTARAVVSYLTIIVCYFAFFNYVILHGFPTRIFVILNLIWLGVGVLELFNPTLSDMISKNRTTLNRGVTSMSPEPTHFGIFLFFMTWLLLASRNYRPSHLILALCLANLIAIFALAKASMVIMILIISLGIVGVAMLFRWIATKGRARGRIVLLGLSGLLALGAIVLVNVTFPDSRVSQITSRALENSPMDLVLRDASINQRLEAIVYSYYGFLHNWMFPGGFDTFLTMQAELQLFWGDIFWYPVFHNKIMSWSGGVIYELGIFGAVFILMLFLASQRGGFFSKREAVVLFVVLLTAIPPAFPLVPMLFALWAAQRYATPSRSINQNIRVGVNLAANVYDHSLGRNRG
ncbi:hypothetical protein [Mesorhizobium sp. M0768]|uniref:hypothetical protein n=1 Tax=Mesorhizobium sp. M0768 TaxID=2956996 RepID=UPI00333CE207